MVTFTLSNITSEQIAEIRDLISSNGELNRSQISRLLCERWNWYSPVGQLKDIRCRALLRELHKRGHIELPSATNRSRIAGKRANVPHLQHDKTPITCELKKLLPLQVEIVESGATLTAFKSFIDQYHYLGYDRTVGECMRYSISSSSGIPLASILFGSASWSCGVRDCHIGWDKCQRSNNLQLLTNNTRMLIYPWVAVPHLASHALSRVLKRLSADWEIKYGHKILAVETYVDTSRFRGICYKAGNWRFLGKTTGRGRDGGHHSAILPVKDVYMYPLDKYYRAKLTNEEQETMSGYVPEDFGGDNVCLR